MTYTYIDEDKKHLHTLNGKPLLGTSTVVGVISKPLTYWASGLACEKFGWTNSKEKSKQERLQIASQKRLEISQISNDDYLNLLDDAYKAHATKLKDSAGKGTDMHAVLEQYVIDCMKAGHIFIVENGEKYLIEFSKWAHEYVAEFLHHEVNVYSRVLWTGGITDVVMKMKTGSYMIGDFKSSKEAYDSQFIQVSGYDIQQRENGFLTPDGEKIGESVDVSGYFIFPFGQEVFTPWARYNVKELRDAFKACVTLYTTINK